MRALFPIVRPFQSVGRMAALLCLSCLAREEEEVTELDYRHCSLDDVPNEIFAYERTLEILRLDCNNIRDLPRYPSSLSSQLSVMPPPDLYSTATD